MKKLILGLVLLAFIMLGTTSVAKATAVTFYVNIALVILVPQVHIMGTIVSGSNLCITTPLSVKPKVVT